jgi:hypothetical protein
VNSEKGLVNNGEGADLLRYYLFIIHYSLFTLFCFLSPQSLIDCP